MKIPLVVWQMIARIKAILGFPSRIEYGVDPRCRSDMTNIHFPSIRADKGCEHSSVGID